MEKWLADDSKEHLSVLGEFGTGKTWFAFHYAWITLQKYLATKAKGIERPRLPLVIPLRDYAKAVTVEYLFSEFFFRIHKIPLPSYSAFEQLNRMGKLLLIFDGFDEMAARIDKQAMINNFWELARVIVPGAKAILTCRTEHFPEDKEERKLLNAELKTATSILTGEAPQFEVLKLEKFNQQQIELVLEKQEVKPTTIKKVMANQELLDLACRPVMVDLIVEALPEIEQGKPVDLARIYLYAVTKKMNRDIETKRTFTSLADKLYFLCELSWEMISTDKMSLNYRNFSERIRRYFGKQVEAKDEDYWGYDMRRNTILVRNSEGDYSPAHRSFLEFFVAYKFAASLGILAEDFTDLARSQNTEINDTAPIQRYTWSQYFFQQVQRPRSNKPLLQLAEFLPETLEHLISFFSHNLWNKAILDLILPMNVQSVQFSPDNKLLATGDIRGSVHLWKVEDGQKLKTLMGHDDWIRCVSFSVDGNLLASASDDETVQLWDVTTGQSKKILKGHTHWVWCVQILGLEEKRMRLDA
ncbi:MAG: NACHT domain-containing protein [Xenococcus sp. (in: cyanobacteria)]